MTELKCPFCHKKLQSDDLLCSCINEKCEESFDMVGTELLWQKVIDLQYDLIDTKKKLDIAVEALTITRRYTAINQFQPKSREAHIVAKKALAKINRE